MKHIRVTIKMSEQAELYQRLIEFLREQVIIHDGVAGATYEVDVRLMGSSKHSMRGEQERKLKAARLAMQAEQGVIHGTLQVTVTQRGTIIDPEKD